PIEKLARRPDSDNHQTCRNTAKKEDPWDTESDCHPQNGSEGQPANFDPARSPLRCFPARIGRLVHRRPHLGLMSIPPLDIRNATLSPAMEDSMRIHPKASLTDEEQQALRDRVLSFMSTFTKSRIIINKGLNGE